MQKVLTAKVCLFWEQPDWTDIKPNGLSGVYGELWVDVNLQQMKDRGDLSDFDQEVLDHREDAEDIPTDIQDAIGHFLAHGGLPVGAFPQMGLPDSICLIDLEWDNREEGDNDAIL